MPRWVPKFTKHPHTFTSSRCVLGGRAKDDFEWNFGPVQEQNPHQNITGHFFSSKLNNEQEQEAEQHMARCLTQIQCTCHHPLNTCVCPRRRRREQTYNQATNETKRAQPCSGTSLNWCGSTPFSFFSLSPPFLSLTLASHTTRFNVYSAVWLLENQLQVELSFKTGEVILVYGDMDEDGFYMGEVDGVRGLVPSNFLTESPATNSTAGGVGGGSANNRNGRMGGAGGGAVGGGMNATGPGARGPPPPNRDGGPNQRAQSGIRKGMWPVERLRCVNQSPPNTQFSFRI